MPDETPQEQEVQPQENKVEKRMTSDAMVTEWLSEIGKVNAFDYQNDHKVPGTL